MDYQKVVNILLRDRGVGELAQDVGVSRQTVHGWRNGKRPRLAHREWLASRLLEIVESSEHASVKRADISVSNT